MISKFIEILNEGKKILKVNKYGSLLFKKNKNGLVSITPISDDKYKGLEVSAVWLDEEIPKNSE